jgi:hypothetical protein
VHVCVMLHRIALPPPPPVFHATIKPKRIRLHHHHMRLLCHCLTQTAVCRCRTTGTGTICCLGRVIYFMLRVLITRSRNLVTAPAAFTRCTSHQPPSSPSLLGVLPLVLSSIASVFTSVITNSSSPHISWQMNASADAATTVVYTSSAAAEQATNVSVWYADTLTATARDWRAVTGPPPADCHTKNASW